MTLRNLIYYLAIIIILFFIESCKSVDSNEIFFKKSIENYINNALDFPADKNSETLYRCRHDFNSDGLVDIAISGQYSGVFGEGGGEWIIYFQRDSLISQRCKKEIFLGFYYIGFNEENSLLFFNKFGCCSGELIEYTFSDNSFTSESKVLEQSDEYDLWIDMDNTFKNLSKPLLEKITYSDYENGKDWMKL